MRGGSSSIRSNRRASLPGKHNSVRVDSDGGVSSLLESCGPSFISWKGTGSYLRRRSLRPTSLNENRILKKQRKVEFSGPNSGKKVNLDDQAILKVIQIWSPRTDLNRRPADYNSLRCSKYTPLISKEKKLILGHSQLRNYGILSA